MPADLLDTNIFVHLIRDDATGQWLKRDRRLLLVQERPMYSVVVEGEVRFLGHQWGWGADRLERMQFLLGYFERLPIEVSQVIEAYAAIDAFGVARGIRMGKNDLWIAATAHAVGAQVLTTDRDFDHLDGIFLNRVLIERQH
jgi:predicted nucleic acid-binding protein